MKNDRAKILLRLRATRMCSAIYGVRCQVPGKFPKARSRLEYMKVREFRSPVNRDMLITNSGKHNVDSYIREIGLAGVFLWTGNFYENLILRGHMNYDQSRDMLIFSQPIIEPSSSRTSIAKFCRHILR